MKQASAQSASAKLIRQELKKAFPKTKFSVTSSSSSMSNSVDVYWTNGPVWDEVTKITNKYKNGRFCGITDSYEDNNRRNDIPQVDFIIAQRRIVG